MKGQIEEGMDVVGFDGVQIGVVDCIEGDRIKLKRHDGSGGHKGHHDYIGIDLVDGIEGRKVRLCSDADIAKLFEERKSGRSVD
ncbi:DUF2171 domain-containing protein [Bradyrhizobium ganzhouense]|uniref:DUF2171 domain-containing protein n=1 Tax=Bradyrhizobium ganzhouense TaxID=1179767 RepID=UPI003CED6CE3